MHDAYTAIGEMAGKIYKTLEQKGGQTVPKLEKEVGATDDSLFNQAIGWLAREGKLKFCKEGRSLKISL